MPSAYKTFAIVGFGRAAAVFAKEFAAHKEDSLKWKILSRSITKPQIKEAELQGAELVAVNYDSQISLINALQAVDVVLSTLRDGGLEDVQRNLVRAAKAAGVKLFVPSEYGRNTIGITVPYLKPKADTHTLLKELDIPYTLFFTGIWPEIVFTAAFGQAIGLDFKAGKFSLFGDGTSASSWTVPEDFIPFVYRLLTTLPPPKLEYRAFEIEGDRKSFKEIIAMWEKKTGRKADIHERSEEEVQAFIDSMPAKFDGIRFFARQWQRGELLVTGEANKPWPEWKPKKWEDFLA
ncbi:hypothetical protein M422DRAFT_239087 [Sphaerobolus stellatus SS14]|nr:hypothetical protein M422DRAFT_239087 [Sphaerobolus stellatus SS14]